MFEGRPTTDDVDRQENACTVVILIHTIVVCV